MADNDQPQRPSSQTFQGLGSLRQALQQARPAPAAPVPTVAPIDIQPQRDELGRSYATGKRKDAVARVWIKPGTGKIDVNGVKARSILRGRSCLLINQPLSRQPVGPV
jgi:small subunit ribosomal protein S9